MCRASFLRERDMMWHSLCLQCIYVATSVHESAATRVSCAPFESFSHEDVSDPGGKSTKKRLDGNFTCFFPCSVPILSLGPIQESDTPWAVPVSSRYASTVHHVTTPIKIHLCTAFNCLVDYEVILAISAIFGHLIA